MTVDMHTHIIVPEITHEAAPDDEWRPRPYWKDGKQYVEFGGKRIDSPIREFVAIETILAEQEKVRVDQIVLTPWASLFRYDADLEASLHANQIQNDALAMLVAENGQRIAALGSVPLQDATAAIAELKRVVNDLGLPGVEIGTNVNGIYLGDARFRKFWATVEELDAVVIVHPVPGLSVSASREYYLFNAWANPAETALTAAHMILSGLLEEHPALKICLVHGGGHLPYQIGRLDRAYQIRPEAQPNISNPPSTYFKKFYFDTIVHSDLALAYLIDLVGVEQIMLGSDYPFDSGYERPVEMVEALTSIGEADKQAILTGNAQRLFGLQ